MQNTLYSNISKRLVLLNRYFKITRFYEFLKSTAYRAGVVVVIFILILLGIDFFVLDINSLLNNLVETYPPKVIFSFFLISETILGIIPPEIFIAWSSKSVSPWLFLFVLATMSYLGGIIAYFIGGRLFLIGSIKNHIEHKIAKHIANLRKWGGIFVLLGALTPIPHSIVSLASGLIKYNFKQYLLWSLFRYVRFVIYALVIFQVFVAP
ncbi:YqaA family protein [Ascidiimonas sp. W6]|uniref:YqaA family protein n=1 Tax=Ascidiimonas meishanensis TaxID=3128903 RepID=UPI0030EE388A